jgi:hypothetical protein
LRKRDRIDREIDKEQQGRKEHYAYGDDRGPAEVPETCDLLILRWANNFPPHNQENVKQYCQPHADRGKEVQPESRWRIGGVGSSGVEETQTYDQERGDAEQSRHNSLSQS